MIQALANGVTSGALIALMAIGFGMVYSTARFFYVAHGAVFTICAYGVYASARSGLPILPAILIGLLAAAAFGVGLEVAVHRPLGERLASGAGLVSSLGVYVVVVNVVVLAFGNETKILSARAGPTWHSPGLTVSGIQAAQLATFVVVAPLVLLFLEKSSSGRAIRALADNPRLLGALGTDVGRLRVIVILLASLLAGLAATLHSLDVGIDPNVGMMALLNAAVAVIIGGVGHVRGSMAGAFVLGLLQQLLLWRLSARWQAAVTFVLLMAFLLFRPRGLFAARRRLEEA